jgi:clan AA aspartic protease
MGQTYADIKLHNPLTGAEITHSCLVDTGATHMCIPAHIALQLGYDLLTAPQREINLANGSRQLAPYVGPLALAYANRSCFVGALVIGDEGLLGSIPMEDMDLVVAPSTRTLAVNPVNPNMPVAVVK